MGLFAWNEGYALGYPEIDAEHKALFRLAEALNTAVQGGGSSEELGSLLARLVAYTRFHFTSEEALMRERRYPRFEEHAREHRQLGEKVAALQRQFEAGEAGCDEKAMQLLRQWLNHHIGGADQEIARFLAASR